MVLAEELKLKGLTEGGQNSQEGDNIQDIQNMADTRAEQEPNGKWEASEEPVVMKSEIYPYGIKKGDNMCETSVAIPTVHLGQINYIKTLKTKAK